MEEMVMVIIEDQGREKMLETTPYTFTSWTLTPGAGGNGNHSDGVRPEASPYHGQGYGGGGDGSYDGNGLHGIVLLEVFSN